VNGKESGMTTRTPQVLRALTAIVAVLVIGFGCFTQVF
jgi:hypothetical protein